MITIKFNNEKWNEKARAFKTQYAHWFAPKTLKRALAVALLASGVAGAGVAYAESDLYRQHKATALHSSTLSASQAIDVALKKVNGRAVSVEFEHRLGDIGEASNVAGKRYEVDIITATGEKHEVGVDANTGEIVYDKAKGAKRAHAEPKIALQQAIQAAIAQTGGVVKDAELEHDDGMAHYEISTVSEQGVKQKVRVNAETGEVMSWYGKWR